MQQQQQQPGGGALGRSKASPMRPTDRPRLPSSAASASPAGPQPATTTSTVAPGASGGSRLARLGCSASRLAACGRVGRARAGSDRRRISRAAPARLAGARTRVARAPRGRARRAHLLLHQRRLVVALPHVLVEGVARGAARPLLELRRRRRHRGGVRRRQPLPALLQRGGPQLRLAGAGQGGAAAGGGGVRRARPLLPLAAAAAPLARAERPPRGRLQLLLHRRCSCVSDEAVEPPERWPSAAVRVRAPQRVCAAPSAAAALRGCLESGWAEFGLMPRSRREGACQWGRLSGLRGWGRPDPARAAA